MCIFNYNKILSKIEFQMNWPLHHTHTHTPIYLHEFTRARSAHLVCVYKQNKRISIFYYTYFFLHFIWSPYAQLMYIFRCETYINYVPLIEYPMLCLCLLKNKSNACRQIFRRVCRSTNTHMRDLYIYLLMCVRMFVVHINININSKSIKHYLAKESIRIKKNLRFVKLFRDAMYKKYNNMKKKSSNVLLLLRYLIVFLPKS